jgi:hypothetical protein
MTVCASARYSQRAMTKPNESPVCLMASVLAVALFHLSGIALARGSLDLKPFRD